MAGLPIPNLTGGAATGLSGGTSDVGNTITFGGSSGGFWLGVALVAVAGFYFYKKGK